MEKFDRLYNSILQSQLIKETHENMPPGMCIHATEGCCCDQCEECKANKAKAEQAEDVASSIKACPYCHGAKTYRGDVCHFCAGSGENPGDVCTSCDGTGKVGHGVRCHRCGGDGKIY